MAYKKSFMGKAWIILTPMITMASWVFMNAAGVIKPGDVGVPYAAYVLLSSSIWALFLGFYTSSADTLNAGSSFILQVKYPHEALLVKQVAQHLADFLLSFCINILILIVLGVFPTWKIIFLPLLMLPLFFLGSGIGLVLSVVSVVAPDLRKVADFSIGLVFYITPIVYSSGIDNQLLQKIMNYNPLTYLVGNTRDIIIYGKFDNPREYFISALISLVVFLVSWKLFFVSEEKVIEKII